VIRDATLDDAEDIATLLGDLGYPATADRVRTRLTKLIGRDDYAVRLFVNGEEIDGLIALTLTLTLHEDTPVVEVAALVVRSDARRRGAGSALLAEADAFARAHKAQRITLSSRTDRGDAHAFYAACGFERTGIRFTRRLEEAKRTSD